MTQTLNIPQKGVSNNNGKLSFNAYFYGQTYYVPVESSKFFKYYEALNIREVEQLSNFIGDLKVKGLLGESVYLSNLATQLTENQVNSVSLVNWPKIEADELLRVVKFYHLYCNGLNNRQSLEAGTIFYHHQDHGVKGLIPTQTVQGGHWDWDLVEEDIVTKEIKELPIAFIDPAVTNNKLITKSWLDSNGWTLVATSHSHNTLDCSWSGSKREKVLNYSANDYSSQAGSLESPKPPLLHLLIRSFSNHQEGLTKFPQFKMDTAINIYGDLKAISTSHVIQDVNSDGVVAELFNNRDFDEYYANLSWCGEEIAKQLATIPVYKPVTTTTTFKGYKGYPSYSYNWQQWQNYRHPDPKPALLTDGETALQLYKNKLTRDHEENDYLRCLILDLLDLLSVDDQINVIDSLIDEWQIGLESCTTLLEIMTMLIKKSENLKEGISEVISILSQDNPELVDVFYELEV